MKKILLTAAVALIFGMVGSANALNFTHTVDLPSGYGNDWITWQHAAPADFEVPFDIINSATITIDYTWIETNAGENVWLDGSFIGTFGVNGNWGWDWDTSVFDVAANLDPFDNGDLLNLSLKINERWDGNGKDYNLGKSTFALDYDNASAPVPEPATMLLFGVGLAGLVGYNRKRSSKKS